MHVIDGREFDWDENKHKENINKHGVTFQEAVTAILEPYAFSSYDFEHSIYEERYRVLGYSKQARLLPVCHCFRNGESITRIFSARKATKQEYDDYWREQNERG